jgi:hypothetical protein
MIPCLLPAIQLSTVVIAGQPLGPEMQQGFRLLVGFDVIFTALALVLVETVLVG